MRLKLDENVGKRGQAILTAASHDVSTVSDQDLAAASDDELIEKCHRESRGLVSLDLDFSNPLRFQPSKYSGIAVLRLSAKPSSADLITLINTLVAALANDSLVGKLWIVEAGRVRVYQEPGQE